MPSRLLFLTVLATAEPRVLERILAVVDGRPILLSEARTTQALKGLTRRQAVEALVDESLMLREAAQIPQSEPRPEELDAALQDLVVRWPAGAGPLPAEALLEVARRQLRIVKYIEFRFRAKARVEDAELREHYEREIQGRPGDAGFDESAASIRETLEARRLDEAVEAWVKELRGAAEIRYNPEAPGPE
jgi:hypothetical protein